MLKNEVQKAQRLVRTDALQLSVGEIVTMYRDKELVIDPNFQRLFRWEIGQKSKLVESLLLGIPLPPIFVFERDDGTWELIDGLQRVSTILEFMGVLHESSGSLRPPSVLIATKYLPSLNKSVWQKDSAIEDVPMDSQMPIEKEHQLAIRRARLAVEILKRPSDDSTKFDLFQRLNAGGTQANAQELRNCIMIMANSSAYEKIKTVADSKVFKTVFHINSDQANRQKHLEFATRILVMTNVPYDKDLDVEDYIDQGAIEILSSRSFGKMIDNLKASIDLLWEAHGADALRKHTGLGFTGKVGLVGLECIAVGVAKNLAGIKRRPKPADFVASRIESFWNSPATSQFSSLGLRGTVRLQRTLPFGEADFKK